MPPASGSLNEAMGDESEVASTAFCRICLCLEPGDELISPCMCKGTQQFVHRSCLDHWRSVKVGIAFSQCTTCKAQFHLRVQFLKRDRCRKVKYRLFVATDILLVFLAIQTTSQLIFFDFSVITAISGVAYLLDKDGKFRNNFANDWVHMLSKHPMLFYYCIGVVVFFALVGLFGLILNSSTHPTTNNRRPRFDGSSNDVPDSWTDSSPEVVFVVIIFVFFILGIVCAYVAATVALQRILQRHYHILIKKDLTKEYIVEDLQGVYTPPKMNPEHEQHLKMLQLM